MSRLAPLKTAGPMLGCVDTRTVRRRLSDLEVPIVRFGRRVLVDLDDLERALEARKRGANAAQTGSPRGVTLALGERLW